jgi:LacI family transcriptional regulator
MSNPPTVRVTMKMLANELGVSKTTVSFALRDHPSISRQMREKIQKLAQERDYRRDPALSAIAASRWAGVSTLNHGTMAFLYNGNSMPDGPQRIYYDGALKTAAALGYKMEAFQVDSHPTATAVSRILYTRGIRGLVIPPIVNAESKRMMHLEWDKFTAVCCGIGRNRPPLHTVTFDIFEQTRLLWELSYKLGYRRIGGAITKHNPVAPDDYFRIGASLALQQILDIPQHDRIPIYLGEARDGKSIADWYQQHRPEVVIGFNFSTAEHLEAAGVRFPEDAQFVALHVPVGERYSGLVREWDEIARVAVQKLAAEIRDNHWGLPDTPQMIQVQPKWNEGSTLIRRGSGATITAKEALGKSA